MTISPADGRQLERRVAAELAERGWVVHPYGLNDECPVEIRGGLNALGSDLMHAPDIIARRRGQRRVALVDAKASIRRDGQVNHCVEIAALESYRRWAVFAGRVRVFLVFADLLVTTPALMHARGERGRNTGSGTGHPYKYADPSSGIYWRFDDVFGRGAAAVG